MVNIAKSNSKLIVIYRKLKDGLVASPMSKEGVRWGSSLGKADYLDEGSGFRVGLAKPSFAVSECCQVLATNHYKCDGKEQKTATNNTV